MPPASQERAHHEEQRLYSTKEYIDYLAFLFSRDDPDSQEDMAQEAREAVVRRLRQAPNCPISHLKVKAKSAILNYRARGSSVDGKLNVSYRSRQYSFIDIDKVVTAEDGILADILYDHTLPFRITEERALHRVLVAQLRSQLDEDSLVLLYLLSLAAKCSDDFYF